MKDHQKIWVRTVIISILLFITGKILFAPLFAFFEPHVDGIDFRIRELPHFVNTSTLFSLVLALLAILVVLMWRYAPLQSMSRKIISLSIILLFIAAGILLRHYQVKNYFTRVVKPFFMAKGRLHTDYPIDPRNFVYYMSAGFCVAYVICWLFPAERKKPGLL